MLNMLLLQRLEVSMLLILYQSARYMLRGRLSTVLGQLFFFPLRFIFLRKCMTEFLHLVYTCFSIQDGMEHIAGIESLGKIKAIEFNLSCTSLLPQENFENKLILFCDGKSYILATIKLKYYRQKL